MGGKSILIIEKTDTMTNLVSDILKWEGYTTICSTSGNDGVSKAREEKPDLVLVGADNIDMSGYDICKAIKDDIGSNLMSLFILISDDNESNRLKVLESEADGYIVKPFNPKELIKKVNNILKAVDRNRGANPLSGLQGNIGIQAEIYQRIERNEIFSVLYADLDNFKAYNDLYGFADGDKAIKLTADILVSSTKLHGSTKDFVGHVGGDDFIVITTPEHVDEICQSIINNFDKQILSLYNDTDKERDYIVSKDRQGIVTQFPIMGISIAVVSNEKRKLVSDTQIADIAAEVKKIAKSKRKSNYVKDRRTT